MLHSLAVCVRRERGIVAEYDGCIIEPRGRVYIEYKIFFEMKAKDLPHPLIK